MDLALPNRGMSESNCARLRHFLVLRAVCEDYDTNSVSLPMMADERMSAEPQSDRSEMWGTALPFSARESKIRIREQNWPKEYVWQSAASV
jgi:hypothetical protein